MKSIKQILIKRDKMSAGEAEDLIQEAKEQFQEYLNNDELDLAEEICDEFFGLEPDYLEEMF